MMASRKKVLISGAVAVALLGIGGGVAMAETSGSAQPSTPGSSAPSTDKQHAKHRAHGLLSRAEHGEFTLGGAKHQVIDVQRGKVQSVSPTSITVQSNDGFTATYTVDSNSKVTKEKKGSTIGQVATGDQVAVSAVKSGSTATVKHLADRGPAKK
ncbi:hypothetical protein F0L68_38540 [Solihabitans fulvus]|uniref:DUF5666 domain-containing protein n=1 Tax=Solihabitans fulvus TaxID=1892852 RepID=A0A5B2WGK4_9PSEU|nr:hypothetical protein [Solihabitans fulvus]KAA2250991.1 hypothetical protein F0L68_38540 [Solihabitans fulvus]